MRMLSIPESFEWSNNKFEDLNKLSHLEKRAFLKKQEVDFEKDNFPFHTNQSLLLHYTENMFQFYTYKEAYDLADLLKAFLNEVTPP